jgi:hypothetical protein
MTGTAEQIVVWLMGQDKHLVYDIDLHKERRSLDSNSYFHVLCDKLRQKLGMSMARCKNHLIADYGQIDYMDGEQIVYKTNCPEERMLELEEPHTKCIRVSEENGRKVYFYRLYRGSHTYNSAEMAQLIKGTVEECKQQDIETATEKELSHMASLWESKYERKYGNLETRK